MDNWPDKEESYRQVKDMIEHILDMQIIEKNFLKHD